MNRSSLSGFSLAIAGLATLPLVLIGCGGGGSSNANNSPNFPTRIVFVSDRQTNNTTKQLYYLDIPGNTPMSSVNLSGATPLTGVPTPTVGIFDQAPAVSPVNNKLVVFQSNRPNSNSTGLDAIWKIDSSGSTPVTTQLTTPTGTETDTDPVWSHDGKKVAFTRLTGGQTDVYVLDMTSSTPVLRQITTNGNNDKDATWSANDSRIAFSSNRNAGTGYDIYTVDDAASEVNLSTPLTTNPGPDEHPQWSPNGMNILYQGKGLAVTDKWTVYSMPLGGTAVAQKTHTQGAVDDRYPRYSPDGRFIVYFSFNNNRVIKFKKETDGASTGGTTLSGPNSSLISSGDSQPFWN